MKRRRPRSRVLGVLIGLMVLIAVPWRIQFAQARINYVVQATIAELRHSLLQHTTQPQTRSPSTAAPKLPKTLRPGPRSRRGSVRAAARLARKKYALHG